MGNSYSAKKTHFKKILCDLGQDFWLSKRDVYMILLILDVIIVIGIVIAIQYDCSLKNSFSEMIHNSHNLNMGLLGINVASLALMSTLSFSLDFTKEIIKKAYTEQNISFIAGAFIQLLGIMLSISFSVWDNDILFYSVLAIQCLAILSIVDILIELYTINKR